jgi:hypothetical protein
MHHMLIILRMESHSFLKFHIHSFTQNKYVQSNLYTTTTLGTQNFRPLLTGGRFSEVGLCYKDMYLDSKMVVVVAIRSRSLGQV